MPRAGKERKMAYERIHPAVLVAYFLSVMIPAVFTLHPMMPLMALAGVVLLLLLTEPAPPRMRTIIWMSLLFLAVVITNPLFNHRGRTELFFLNGHAITLEAVLFGLRNAACVIAVLLWCHCMNRFVTGEKWLAILGRHLPKTALLVSSAMRLVPLLRKRGEEMRKSQQALGLYGDGDAMRQLSGGAKVFSMLVTWSLDHAVSVSASMKARGYGLRGRTTYSVYRFRREDAILLTLLIAADALVLTALAGKALAFDFYPVLNGSRNALTVPGLMTYGLMVLFAPIWEGRNRFLWNCYRSKI